MLADGRELIDGIASWWTACHGYNHPHIRQAVERQLAEMPHVMLGGLVHEQALTLARRLAALLPGDLDRVFFSKSGSVAVEIAMKMVDNTGSIEAIRRRRNLSRSRAAITATPPERWRSAIRTPGCTLCSVGCCQNMSSWTCRRMRQAAMRSNWSCHDMPTSIAGFIVEPLVQGAGGMRFHDAATLQRLREIADRCGVLLILDEIFTGLGRTGTMFACEQAGVIPDIITLSKALTGGTLPLAATVTRKGVFDAFWSDDPQKALMHGPTYMGNALACAAANASLDLFEREPRLAQVAAISAQMERELARCREMAGVKDVRVRGAIGVVEMERIAEPAALRARFVEEGVFIRPFGNVIYLDAELHHHTGRTRHPHRRNRQGDQAMIGVDQDSMAVPCRSYSSARAILTVAKSPTRKGRLLLI